MMVREYIKNTWKVFTDPSGFAPYPYVPPCLDDGSSSSPCELGLKRNQNHKNVPQGLNPAGRFVVS